MRLRIWRQRSLGLRTRLALGYTAVLIIALLALGIVAGSLLNRGLRDVARDDILEDSSQIRRYFRGDGDQIRWEFDISINEEAFFVRRLRRVLLVTSTEGKPIEASNDYQELGVESPAELAKIFNGPLPVFRSRMTANGTEYLLRSEIIRSAGREYWVTIGREVDADRLVLTLTTNYYLIALPACALLSLIGWWLAGRALQPLNEVSRAAQAVSGSNLATLIPMRGAGDELDHLIATFNAMTERLEASFNQIKHFSTDVSHELRTPLTTIRGQLEVAMLTASSEAELREAMIGCIDEVEHLSRLVTALLQLASAESGQLIVSRDRLDFTKLVSEVTARFSEMADIENIALRIHCEAICQVAGDRTQLDRLVTNLVTNALKYTPPGGRVDIRVKPSEAGDHVLLSVEDNGRGIPAQHIPHIFDRFYRVARSSPDPERGLGLGLSFVAWIAKAHGGQIEVVSESGVGSVFRVSLPMYKEAAA